MTFRRVILIFGIFIGLIEATAKDFSDNSILKSGKWFKIKIVETGIYKISYEDLISMGFEAPQNIRIYGNGGEQLPFLNSTSFLDDLVEVPLFEKSGSNFGPGDYYLFYAEGTVSWTYNNLKGIYVNHLHDYSENNYYYLTASFGPGERISKRDNSALTSTVEVTEYDYRSFHEKETKNFTSSGNRWFGENFAEAPLEIGFKINNIVSNSEVKLFTAFAVRSSSDKEVSIKVNSSLVGSLGFKFVLTQDSEATIADVKDTQISFLASTPDLNVKMELLGYKVGDAAYLDFLIVNARSKLTIDSEAFFFRDNTSIVASGVGNFRLSNAVSSIQVWNITDHNKVYEILGEHSGGIFSFKDSVNKQSEYVAVDINHNFSRPIFTDADNNDVGWIENQNIHSITTTELLIVTHPDFIAQAEELAQLHRDKDGMTVAVVTTEQIYNEFSSGKADVSAIRNFARMLYEYSGTGNTFKYLLLFGDGSYDNRSQDPVNPNYIPTFQTENSVSPTVTYSTDDIYGMLDPDEWRVGGTIDIGVGRIPVKSVESQLEAQGVVDKIKLYYDQKSMKDWRNRLIFLGDDGESGWDNKVFMVDSDSLTKIIEGCAPSMNFTKIYLDAYQQISSSTGAAYPDVEKALDYAFKRGALVFNYMGHGGENGITQEKVFQTPDFEKLSNSPNFPLFMTATCQLSRFDNVIIDDAGRHVSKISAGEVALLNPTGGAIALFTTTRLVYQSSNYRLSRNVYKELFSKDEKGRRYRLGDILRIAKNKTNDTSNKFKFALLGDPAITLAYGEYKVITDSINGKYINNIDTVNALGNMRISGYVAYDDSTMIGDFNGVIQVNVFDKVYLASTRGNDGIPVFDFTMQDKLLFRGKATVKEGRFSVEFKIPKDISYSFGKGKISYYAQNGYVDAKGYHKDFYIGGTSENAELDFEGPEIKLYMNDKYFEDGGITNSSPVLLADLYDENGINTTGNGIGHDLVGVMDEDYSENYLLNDFYEGELDDYRKGTIVYPLSELDEGYHEILVKVWDIYNNSSEEQIGFYVKQSNEIAIDKVYNYPNPMRDETNFQYSHNMPGNHEVKLEIYDLTGKLVYIYNHSNIEGGFVSQPISWHRKSLEGSNISPGVYPYRLHVTVSGDNDQSKFSSFQNGRLIIIP